MSISQDLQEQLKGYVERILAADISALEGEIDQLIYALYGLTEQEIEIIEGASAKDGEREN